MRTSTTVSVAAVPFDDGSAPETFSSRGPVAVSFGPVVGTDPAAAPLRCAHRRAVALEGDSGRTWLLQTVS